jgi:hypothetical protein
MTRDPSLRVVHSRKAFAEAPILSTRFRREVAAQ